ncbi:MAG: N-acetylglucosamine-6-phosphate deacetylase [Holdemanella sp.]|nr:N-acetylglucosamine-6-phosphate deacetylase [Holdemanella sp.]
MIIQSTRVWIAGQFMPAQIKMEGKIITGVMEYGKESVDVDYGSDRIVPGFIDIHTHGYNTWDTNDATPEGLRYWMKNITSEGVTGICPTTITQSHEVLSNAIKNVVKVVEEGYEGAEILGIHFEGPYLNQKYKGAQPEQYCITPDVEEFKEYQKDAKGMIKVITMACECDADFKLTEYCSQNGVLVSQGHSGASFEEARMAIAHGAMSMTHVFNGMTPFHHRNPGLVGAAMRFRDVYGEVICDGNHSDVNSLNNYYMAKGRDYVIMISDALMAKGCPVGSKFIFGGQEIEVYPDGSAHLTGSKALAGSTLNINRGLQIVVEKAGVPFDYALNSCTINPARALRIDDHKGKICTGYDADLVVLNNEYDVIQTYARGKACK